MDRTDLAAFGDDRGVARHRLARNGEQLAGVDDRRLRHRCCGVRRRARNRCGFSPGDGRRAKSQSDRAGHTKLHIFPRFIDGAAEANANYDKIKYENEYYIGRRSAALGGSLDPFEKFDGVALRVAHLELDRPAVAADMKPLAGAGHGVAGTAVRARPAAPASGSTGSRPCWCCGSAHWLPMPLPTSARCAPPRIAKIAKSSKAITFSNPMTSSYQFTAWARSS